MRDSDARKLDHETLEQRRVRAVGQVEQAPISTRSPQAGDDPGGGVAWLATYREGGLERPRLAPSRDGRRSRRVPQLARPSGLVVGNDPRRLRLALALGTPAMARELLGREFGAARPGVSVGRLLRTLGRSPQRPPSRASQPPRPPETVARWKAETYPGHPRAGRPGGCDGLLR